MPEEGKASRGGRRLYDEESVMGRERPRSETLQPGLISPPLDAG